MEWTLFELSEELQMEQVLSILEACFNLFKSIFKDGDRFFELPEGDFTCKISKICEMLTVSFTETVKRGETRGPFRHVSLRPPWKMSLDRMPTALCCAWSSEQADL